MNRINDQWDKVSASISKSYPPNVVRLLRQTFFSGARTMLAEMLKAAAADDETNELHEVIAAMAKELAEDSTLKGEFE